MLSAHSNQEKGIVKTLINNLHEAEPANLINKQLS